MRAPLVRHAYGTRMARALVEARAVLERLGDARKLGARRREGLPVVAAAAVHEDGGDAQLIGRRRVRALGEAPLELERRVDPDDHGARRRSGGELVAVGACPHGAPTAQWAGFGRHLRRDLACHGCEGRQGRVRRARAVPQSARAMRPTAAAAVDGGYGRTPSTQNARAGGRRLGTRMATDAQSLHLAGRHDGGRLACSNSHSAHALVAQAPATRASADGLGTAAPTAPCLARRAPARAFL